MALRKILQNGDPALRKLARPVEKFDRRLHILLDDMAKTMYDANGCGLAAPQVGILQRVIVIDMGDESDPLIELINPEIIAAEGEVEGTEGCLSVLGRRGYVVRPERVTVRAQDRFGARFEMSGEGMLARCFCHEIDHLQGRLYIDIMTRDATDEEDEEPNDAPAPKDNAARRER